MPTSNIRLMFLAIVVCIVCASRTSIKEQVLLHTYRKIQNLSIRSPSSQDLFEGAMEGMTAKLRDKYKDPYSYYENAEKQKDINNKLENTLVGIGVFMEYNPDKTILLFPLPNSPAIRAGIQYGDVLLKVNDEEIADLSPNEVSERIKGPEGTPVTITVRHPEQETPNNVRIVREVQQMATIVGDTLRENGQWNYTLQTDPKIGYIALRDSFSKDTAGEMAAALEILNRKNIQGLILDLRGNPGGYLQSAVAVCQLFLNKGTIVTVKRRDGSVKNTYKADGSPLWTKPMVVLVNHDSASASEIVAACLQDHHRAIVVGERSYGKGTVQEIFDLPMNLGTLRLTDAEYQRPSGKNINRFPDNTEEDVWGVFPNEGYRVPVSSRQSILIYRIRQLRSVIPEEELDSNIELLIQRVSKAPLPQSVSDSDDESAGPNDHAKNETDLDRQPFVPEGNAPYYDPQLIKAIETIKESLLRNENG